MAKSRDAFRTISEVSDWLETPAHVLRFWESRFSQIKPVKRAGGRRYYRPVDMELLGGIKRLLHDDGITIKGVQKILREKGVKYVAGLSLEKPGDGTHTPEPPEETPVDVLITASDEADTLPPGSPDMVPPGADWSASEPAEFATTEPLDALSAAEVADETASAPEIAPESEPESGPGTVLPPVTPPPTMPKEAPIAPAAQYVAPRPEADRPAASPAPAAAVDTAPDSSNEDRLSALYARLAALRNRVREEVSAN